MAEKAESGKPRQLGSAMLTANSGEQTEVKAARHESLPCGSESTHETTAETAESGRLRQPCKRCL